MAFSKLAAVFIFTIAVAAAIIQPIRGEAQVLKREACRRHH
jgi:hypothetical protein